MLTDRCPDSLKDAGHISQEQCVRKCLDRDPDAVNAAWHRSHLYGRSPVCVRMCLDRCPKIVNAALHTSHLYGRSPV
jgi:hypothetical protein